jgi:hypothetical protein
MSRLGSVKFSNAASDLTRCPTFFDEIGSVHFQPQAMRARKLFKFHDHTACWLTFDERSTPALDDPEWFNSLALLRRCPTVSFVEARWDSYVLCKLVVASSLRTYPPLSNDSWYASSATPRFCQGSCSLQWPRVAAFRIPTKLLTSTLDNRDGVSLFRLGVVSWIAISELHWRLLCFHPEITGSQKLLSVELQARSAACSLP